MAARTARRRRAVHPATPLVDDAARAAVDAFAAHVQAARDGDALLAVLAAFTAQQTAVSGPSVEWQIVATVLQCVQRHYREDLARLEQATLRLVLAQSATGSVQ